MLTTKTRLRYVVGAGLVALLAIGTVGIVMAGDAEEASGSARLAQIFIAAMLAIAVVLAWFAYSSLSEDLDQRAAAEDALRASEAKYSGILAIAVDAIISVDDSQRIIHYNQGAETIFGWSAAEAVGRDLSFLLPGRHREHHAAHVKGFQAAPETSRPMGQRRAISGLRRDGTEFPAEASISKLALPHGRNIFTVVLRDVTERRLREESERHLRESVSLLGETLELDATERSIAQLPIGWLGDAALLDVITGHGSLRRVPARPADGALAAALARVAAHPLDMDSPSRVVDVLRRGVTEHVPVVTDEWIEAHSSDVGEYERLRALRMGSLLLLPLVAREHVLGVLKIIRVGAPRPFSDAERAIADELALRAAFALDNARLYEAAQEATIARDHALGVVSHDLRNPISAIGMCARALLNATAETDTERRGLVTTIVDSTELTQRMIRDLLDVASIEVGRLSVERRTVSIRSVIERGTALFERDAAERGVRLMIAEMPELPPTTGDEERLVQVLANLVGNALRFTDRGGAVQIGARRDGAMVEVSVHDTGAGIPATELPRIFERYWTVRRNAPKGGTGLGLAIARGIVEAHGGRLWAESTVGVGSTFRFTVPIG
jgi:PAS domain S-box-containing protein